MSEAEGLARKIALGHAKDKHFESWNTDALERLIQRTFDDFARCYPPGLGHPRKIYESKDGIIVIVDAASSDGGTCFWPDNPDYFDDLVDEIANGG